MTWQPGQPVLTACDHADWQAWRKARKLEQQRQRRQRINRIDYQPSDEALAVIRPRLTPRVGGDYSSVIDTLILAATGKPPE
jgi:hypothetical protein